MTPDNMSTHDNDGTSYVTTRNAPFFNCNCERNVETYKLVNFILKPCYAAEGKECTQETRANFT